MPIIRSLRRAPPPALAAGLLGAFVLLASAPFPAAAQERPSRPAVAVLNLAFSGDFANVLEPDDTAIVQAATSKLLGTLQASDQVVVVDSARVAAQVAAAEPGGNPCGNACTRAVAQRLGAQWVVKGTVTKTSNLVWLLSAELIDVATGRAVLHDGYELKGQATAMVPAGAHVFAQRVEKTIANRRAATVAP